MFTFEGEIEHVVTVGASRGDLVMYSREEQLSVKFFTLTGEEHNSRTETKPTSFKMMLL